jgi:DNA/RNA-binding domain of Phe-tRNA-synthetase-like protein
MYPGAVVGVLVMRNVSNPPQHAALEERKVALEAELRARFAGQDRAALRALPVLQAYDAYYRQFKKTYHVQLQLESVVFKGRSLPGVAALVEAMFMAELKNLLLTAGHDLDAVREPVTLDVAQGTERYTCLGGQETDLKPGDMVIADAQGVLSSIIYGPDARTPITPGTRNVLFTVYGPPGIGAAAMQAHLEDIRDNVRLVAPESEVAVLECLTGGG